ncbi:arginyltransferase [Zhongshania sp.]|uniref:arginyltransferase n=1 Tax=Zhongshania sp. TaxID=1971902 RepID=UPI003562055C
MDLGLVLRQTAIGQPMTDPQQLKLYATHPHPCSYFADREAKTIFIDPEAKISGPVYSELSRRGFRRSGNHLYRPDCGTCKACIASRVPVTLFRPSRTQRRVEKRNSDLVAHILSAPNADAYPLYEKYINGRHRDGDMYPPSKDQFDDFLGLGTEDTQHVHFYLGDTLVAVAVTDVLNDGLSAIYTFYDPEYPRRSLGVYGILWQIAHCRDLALPYLYLGYWIRDCQKMRYKTDYKPIELLMSDRWLRLT